MSEEPNGDRPFVTVPARTVVPTTIGPILIDKQGRTFFLGKGADGTPAWMPIPVALGKPRITLPT